MPCETDQRGESNCHGKPARKKSKWQSEDDVLKVDEGEGGGIKVEFYHDIPFTFSRAVNPPHSSFLTTA